MTAAKVPVPTPDDIPKPTQTVATRFARTLLEVQPVHKTKTAKVTDTFTYKYAVKTACTRNGLAIAQTVESLGDRWQIVTIIIDVDSGDALSYPGPIMPMKGEPQAMGSALTYARRYALTTLFALNVDDDDGQQAQRAAAKPDSRTPAEVEIRRLLATFDKDLRKAFADDFKAQFGCSLLDLAESRHGDALAWTKWWQAPGDEAEPTFEVEEVTDEVDQ